MISLRKAPLVLAGLLFCLPACAGADSYQGSSNQVQSPPAKGFSMMRTIGAPRGLSLEAAESLYDPGPAVPGDYGPELEFSINDYTADALTKKNGIRRAEVVIHLDNAFVALEPDTLITAKQPIDRLELGHELLTANPGLQSVYFFADPHWFGRMSQYHQGPKNFSTSKAFLRALYQAVDEESVDAVYRQ